MVQWKQLPTSNLGTILGRKRILALNLKMVDSVLNKQHQEEKNIKNQNKWNENGLPFAWSFVEVLTYEP